MCGALFQFVPVLTSRPLYSDRLPLPALIYLLPGVEFVDVKLSYDPPWTSQMISSEAKVDLGFVDGRD